VAVDPKERDAFPFPDLSSLFEKVGQLFEKERVVNVTEQTALPGQQGVTMKSTLLIVPRSVDLNEAKTHWADWCKKTFVEYLVEFKNAKVIEVEEFSIVAKSEPVWRSEAPGHRKETARGSQIPEG